MADITPISGMVTADYIELADASPVEYNDSELAVFEDLDYVEGSWNWTYHRKAVDDGLENSLTSADLAIIKLGAIAPDQYIRDMRVHPEWHGFTSYQRGANNGQGFSNYISSYIYITEIASAIFRGVDPKNVTPNITISNTSVDVIRMLFRDNNQGIIEYTLTDDGVITGSKELAWSSVMGGALNNKRNRALFVYGLAIHSMSDVFAHSIKYPSGVYLDHQNDCDGPARFDLDNTVLPNRFECNVNMIETLFPHIMRMESANLNDYYSMANNSEYDGSFKLNRFVRFMKEIDLSFYNSRSAVFNRIGTN